MPLFSGKAFYPPGKRVLDDWSTASNLGLRPNHVLEPKMQLIFLDYVIFKRESCRVFWHTFGGEISSVRNLPFTVAIYGLHI